WLALAAPLVWKGRPVEEVSGLRWFAATVFLLFMICALTLCLFFSADSCCELVFLPALMLLAVIGFFGLERALGGWLVWRRIARWGWCLLLAYSVVFNILASVEAHAEANDLIGNSLLHQGRAEEALEHFQKALALQPESATFHNGLGNALYQKGRMDEAIIQYQKALVLQPKSAAAYEYLGEALFQKGQMDGAIIQYQRALEIKPDFVEAHNNLGSSLLQMGRVDEAIAYYRRAIELQPRLVQAYNDLGYAFFRKSMAAEAIACYQKAIELQPQFIPA